VNPPLLVSGLLGLPANRILFNREVRARLATSGLRLAGISFQFVFRIAEEFVSKICFHILCQMQPKTP
jgi:hypothetical protein